MSEEPLQPETPAARRPSRSGQTGARIATAVGMLVAVAAVGLYVYFFVWKKPPAKVQPKVVARFTAVEGTVRVKAPGATEWTVGKSGQSLRTGDVVQTDLKSGAAITFISGNAVTIRQDTVVLISEGEADVAREATAWHVQSGQVNFDLKQRTDIVTANTRTTTSADASGSINVTDEGTTGVKIFRGSAEVSTTGGQTVKLTNNQAVLVDKKGAAGAKIALPPPPTLSGPPSMAEVPYAAPPDPTVHLEWNAVNGAATYQVAMDYNVIQAQLLLSAAFEPASVPGTTHDMTALDPGKYFWRVAGVTPEGLEGEFSAVSIFAVLPIPPPPARSAPRLSAQAVDLESVVEVTGQTEPGAQLTVDGASVKVLPDGRFTEHFRKTGRDFVVLKVTRTDGQVTEEKIPVAAR